MFYDELKAHEIALPDYSILYNGNGQTDLIDASYSQSQIETIQYMDTWTCDGLTEEETKRVRGSTQCHLRHCRQITPELLSRTIASDIKEVTGLRWWKEFSHLQKKIWWLKE